MSDRCPECGSILTTWGCPGAWAHRPLQIVRGELDRLLAMAVADASALRQRIADLEKERDHLNSELANQSWVVPAFRVNAEGSLEAERHAALRSQRDRAVEALRDAAPYIVCVAEPPCGDCRACRAHAALRELGDAPKETPHE